MMPTLRSGALLPHSDFPVFLFCENYWVFFKISTGNILPYLYCCFVWYLGTFAIPPYRSLLSYGMGSILFLCWFFPTYVCCISSYRSFRCTRIGKPCTFPYIPADSSSMDISPVYYISGEVPTYAIPSISQLRPYSVPPL